MWHTLHHLIFDPLSAYERFKVGAMIAIPLLAVWLLLQMRKAR